MTTNDLIKHFHTAGAAQKALGVSRQLFAAWKRCGIPVGRQAEIQLSTGGALRAEQRGVK